MVSNRIKELRLRHHLSQKEFAEKIGVSQGAVSQWENGITSMNAEQLRTISQVFGVSMESIVEENDNEETQSFTHNRFKECRERMGFSQKFVALSIGVEPPQISKWEAGTQGPSRENSIKLAKLFKVSLDYLMGLSDDPSQTVEPSKESEFDPSQTDDSFVSAIAMIGKTLHQNPQLGLLLVKIRKMNTSQIAAMNAVADAILQARDSE